MHNIGHLIRLTQRGSILIHIASRVGSDHAQIFDLAFDYSLWCGPLYDHILWLDHNRIGGRRLKDDFSLLRYVRQPSLDEHVLWLGGQLFELFEDDFARRWRYSLARYGDVLAWNLWWWLWRRLADHQWCRCDWSGWLLANYDWGSGRGRQIGVLFDEDLARWQGRGWLQVANC